MPCLCFLSIHKSSNIASTVFFLCFLTLCHTTSCVDLERWSKVWKDWGFAGRHKTLCDMMKSPWQLAVSMMWWSSLEYSAWRLQRLGPEKQENTPQQERKMMVRLIKNKETAKNAEVREFKVATAYSCRVSATNKSQAVITGGGTTDAWHGQLWMCLPSSAQTENNPFSVWGDT